MRSRRGDCKNASKRLQIKRAMMFAFAVGIGNINPPSQCFAQSNNGTGDLPASPWSNQIRYNTIPEQTKARSSELNAPEMVRQPIRTTQSASAPAPSSQSSRPASVTMFGPIATPKPGQSQQPRIEMTPPNATPSRGYRMETALPDQTDSKIPASTSSFTVAAQPNNALTQKKPIAAQSDWHRVRAGGLILEDAAPEPTDEPIEDSARADDLVSSRATEAERQRFGLPERTPPTAHSVPSNSRMVSTKALELPPNTDEHGQAIRLRATNATPSPSSDRIMVDGLANEEPQRNFQRNIQPTETALELSNGLNPKPPVVAVVPEQLGAPTDIDRTVDLGSKTASDRKKTEEYEIQRVALAQKVSHELLSQSPYPASRAPEILEAPPGWQSVRQELTTRLERCDSLLKRGAVHSAREEALQGMRRLFRTMDIHRRSLVSEPAFDKAIIALKEEADFQNIVGNNQHLALPSIVASHATEALKGRPLDNVSPEIAAQHYRMYARYQLVLASDGHPWASDLLYAYGKTLEKEAEQEPSRGLMLRNQSVACYQAATQVAPNQSEASNQLGFALIHLDRIDEAYQALTASIQNRPTANAWNNLAEIYRRQGANDKAEYAVQQATSLSAQSTAYSAENPEVTEVDPAVFAKYSPMPAVGNQIPTASSSANNPAAGKPARTATAPNSIMSKIFR